MKDEKLFLRMSSDLRSKITVAAEACGESESYVVREALRQYFALHEPKAVAAPIVPPKLNPAALVAQIEAANAHPGARRKSSKARSGQ